MMKRNSRALPFALAHAGQLSAEALRRFSGLRENTVATSESVKNQNFWRVLKGCGTPRNTQRNSNKRKTKTNAVDKRETDGRPLHAETKTGEIVNKLTDPTGLNKVL